MRGVFSAKVPSSSFAEAHKVLLSEPTHMEDEKKIRRMKRKMRETVTRVKWRVEENHDAQPHETWMTRCALHLEPMSRATLK